jgi:hypothetical protein
MVPQSFAGFVIGERRSQVFRNSVTPKSTRSIALRQAQNDATCIAPVFCSVGSVGRLENNRIEIAKSIYNGFVPVVLALFHIGS